jgi:hypothetical protein
MRRRLVGIAVAAAVAVLPACGGGDGDPNPGGGTPVITSANLTVTQNGAGSLCISPRLEYFWRLQVPVRIVESNGLGANLNFVRMSILSASGAEIERAEVGAPIVTNTLGSNHINASATVQGRFDLDFNSEDFDSVRLLFNFTDDRGANHDKTLDRVNPLNLTIICQ